MGAHVLLLLLLLLLLVVLAVQGGLARCLLCAPLFVPWGGVPALQAKLLGGPRP